MASFEGTSIEYFPLKSVMSPLVVPLSITLAPGRGSVVPEVVTFPVMVRAWPNEGAEKAKRQKQQIINAAKGKIAFFPN